MISDILGRPFPGRKERKEAMGIEESRGMLPELLDELTEEVTGEAAEKIAKGRQRIVKKQ